MDKPVRLHLNANRYISGTLRGYDMFLNLVLDDTMEDVGGGETVPIKTTVSVQIVSKLSCLFSACVYGKRADRPSFRYSSVLSLMDLFDTAFGNHQVVRGNSVVSIELLHNQRVYR
jgi:small nuclear ribonucleoprotein (snRNP)-like protein